MRDFRVLVAYEELYSVYAEAFGQTVRRTEPYADVRLAAVRDLWEAASHFDPHLVVSSQPTDAVAGVDVWFMLSPEPDEPSEMRLGDRHWYCTNPGIDGLMRVVEAVSGLVREDRYRDAV